MKHRTELLEVQERGDVVLALTNDHLTGRDGMELSLEGASLYTLRDGKVARLEVFPDAVDRAKDAFAAGAGSGTAP